MKKRSEMCNKSPCTQWKKEPDVLDKNNEGLETNMILFRNIYKSLWILKQNFDTYWFDIDLCNYNFLTFFKFFYSQFKFYVNGNSST